jgi:oligopeptide transport system substrate-binding protein
MGRLLLPVILLLALVGVSVLSDRPLPRADLTFINRGDVTTLDLQRMSWMQDLRVATVLFEGLVRNDVFTWEYAIRPAVAERWEISPDGRTYTFHLRGDAKWSNGDRVRAQDFVYSWRRALLPDTAAKYTGIFQLIEGSREFYAWRAEALAAFAAGRPVDGITDAYQLWDHTRRKFEEMVAVQAVDDSTLVVKLYQPVPYFLDLCAFPVFYPIYPPLVEPYERPDPRTGRIQSRRDWTKPPRLISNGPFKLALWRFKRDMRLEKNEHYWDAGSIRINTINMPSVEDPNAQVLAFQTGAVEYVSDVSVPYRPEMLAQKQEFYREHRPLYEKLKAEGHDQFEIDRRLPPDPRKNIHAVPAFGTYWYNFNCLPRLRDGRPNPFADPRVRRAFTMAIDKQTLVDEVMRIGNPVLTTIIPPGSIGGYTSPRGVPFDPAGARRLLAEAGYSSGRDFPITVDLMFNSGGGHDKIAEFVAKNWQQHLGVQTSLTQKEIKVFRDDLQNANFITARGGWYGDYGDPTTFLDLNRSWDGNNDRKYATPEFDALLERAAVESDPEARMRMLEEAERLLMDEHVPMAPLFQYVTLYLFDAHKVSGLNPHPRGDQHLYLIEMIEKTGGAAKVMPLRPAGQEGPAFAPRASLSGGQINTDVVLHSKIGLEDHESVSDIFFPPPAGSAEPAQEGR